MSLEDKTSIPLPKLGPNGYELPEETDILTGVQNDFNAAFGGQLNPQLSTPQGQLAQSLAAIVADRNALFANYVNQVDPNYASGRMQDAIARIYFIERKGATYTIVYNVVCNGTSGTLIPKGTLVQDKNGHIYQNTQDAVIPDNQSSVQTTFQCTTTGPIECPPNTLTTIYQILPGFESVNNPQEGIIGSNEEGQLAFEERRADSVAHNGINTLEAVRSAILDQSVGAIDAYVAENYTSNPVTIGTVPLKAHSIYICVAGSTPDKIAPAIWLKKPPGCDMNGDTTFVVEDSQGQPIQPYPSYLMRWQTAKAVELTVKVQIAYSTSLPPNSFDLVRQAVMNVFENGTNGQRGKIGATLYATDFLTAVAQSLPSVVHVVTLTLNGEPEIAVGIDQIPALSTDHIDVEYYTNAAG